MPYAEEPENNLRGFEVEAGLATFAMLMLFQLMRFQ